MTEPAAQRRHPTSQIAKRLPFDFTISENDVYVGRGNLYRYHPGNERYNQLVLSNLERYYNAANRNDKTAIIYQVVDQVRANSPYGGFVKQNTKSGYWYEVGDAVAREKTSQAFRDATIGLYKSSRTLKCSKVTGQKRIREEDSVTSLSEFISISKKRSFAEVCNDSNQSNIVKKRFEDDHVTNFCHDVFEKNKVYDGVFVTYDGSNISSSNRNFEGTFNEDLDGQKTLAFGRSFCEYRIPRSQSSEGSCSSTSSATILDDLIRFEEQEVVSAQQIPFADQSLQLPTTNTTMTQELMLLDPSLTTIHSATLATISNIESKTSIATADIVRYNTTGSAVDTKSDEETFDLLLQLYESWNRGTQVMQKTKEF